MPPDVDLADLILGPSLGMGAEGEVFALDSRPDQVIKRYWPTVPVDADALAAVVAFPEQLSDLERDQLLSGATWPTARVVQGERVVGYLMARIPAPFLGRTASSDQQPRELQYLMFEPNLAWGGIRPLPVDERITFLRLLLGTMCVLHNRGVVFRDLSQANVLWCDGGGSMLIDCGAVCIPGHNAAVPAAETPEWMDPLFDEGSADLESDRYKIAMIVLRVLTSRADTVPPDLTTPFIAGIPSSVATACVRLISRAGGPRSDRPTAAEWYRALHGLLDPVAAQVPRLAPPDLGLAAELRPERQFTRLGSVD